MHSVKLAYISHPVALMGVTASSDTVSGRHGNRPGAAASAQALIVVCMVIFLTTSGMTI